MSHDQQPVRNVVRRSHVSHVGCVASFKMRDHVQFESTLERDYVIRCDADPDVTQIFSQPAELYWNDQGRRLIHVPDYLVVRRGVYLYVEVKYEDEAPQFRARSEELDLQQRRIGRRYRLITERWIRTQPYLNNAIYLRNGRRSEPSTRAQQAAKRLLQMSDQSISRIRAETGLTVNEIYWMILAGHFELADRRAAICLDSCVRLRTPQP